MNTADFPHLATISSPHDLRQLTEDQLGDVASELREYLLQSLDKSGGHLGAGLGVIELTVALHYIFNTPDDRLVWDVGHQAYPHKVLTGRRDQLPTIRRCGGLSPFPKRSESEYDCFGVGHSSTSISAAIGMALAAQQKGDDRKVVAIIGDGAMTGGMAFEAMAHAGDIRPNMLVILNDNNMSISPNVGGFSNYLGNVISSSPYNAIREGGKKVLKAVPPLNELVKRTEEHLKGMVVPGTLFEELGFHYSGPVDGSDLPKLIKKLKTLKNLSGPQFLHIKTVKGKGYAPAEADPIGYHAVKPNFYDSKLKVQKAREQAAEIREQREAENNLLKKPAQPTYANVFGEWLCDMAKQDKRLVGITPAMREGSDLVRFSQEYPDRYYDVAIAEQHAVTLAAGIACEGQKPVVAIYSTFLQRGYDQLIHDVALQNLPVLFAIDRAGLVGGDGATHSGRFDLSYLRCVPNMIVMAPADENECRQMLYTGFMHDGPTAVRYPRGTGPNVAIEKNMTTLPIGKAQLKREGKRVAILAFGTMVETATAAGEKLDATVVNMRFVKPLDENLIIELAKSHDLLVTVEENTIAGGAGSGVAECLNANAVTCPMLQLGLPDHFLDHGDPKRMLKDVGLDCDGIVAAITPRTEDRGPRTVL